MVLNPGNTGPPDTRPARDRVITLFQPGSAWPALYEARQRNDSLSTRGLVTWSAQDLRNCHMLPPDSQAPHRPGLIKVVFPPNLTLYDDNPYTRRHFDCISDYETHLILGVPESGPNRRRLGLYLETEDGRTRNHWVVIGGQPFNITVPPPQCILNLMTELGATPDQLPQRMKAKIPLWNINFLISRIYTDWENLENIGFDFHPAAAPQAVLNRVKARFRLWVPNSPTHQNVKLILEAVILPPELVWTEIFRERLDTPDAPTFLLWQYSVAIPWLDTYPTLPGYFLAKNPVPFVHETKPNVTAPLSEYNQRRVSYEVIRQAARRNNHTQLDVHYEWLRHPTALPTHMNPPVLFLPPIPNVPEPPLNDENMAGDVDSDDDDPSVEIVSDILLPLATSPGPTTSRPTQHTTTTPGDHPLKALEFSHNPNPAKPGLKHKPEPAPRPQGIIVTANGKYDKGPPTNYPHLTKSLQNTLPDATQTQAEILARLTMASTANNTTRAQTSIQRTVLKLFPDRPTLFTDTKQGDPLIILSRLIEAGYKYNTAAAYIKAYDAIVAANGGYLHPKLPQHRRILTGLRNLSHNPTAAIADKKRKAYSMEALTLVAQLGVHLMRKNKKWTSHHVALYRATILTLFYGRLRSNEALGRNNYSYDLYTSLLAGDVLLDEQPDRAYLLLRSAKYQEQQGALVAIPALDIADCPVKALKKYAKRRARLTSNKQLPFFLTATRWTHGDSRPTPQTGVYTASKFSRDTKAVVRELVKHRPSLKQCMSLLVTHSLRSGVPTELQDQDIPSEIRLQLGRWHSSAHKLYQKNAKAAGDVATTIEKHINLLAHSTAAEN